MAGAYAWTVAPAVGTQAVSHAVLFGCFATLKGPLETGLRGRWRGGEAGSGHQAGGGGHQTPGDPGGQGGWFPPSEHAHNLAAVLAAGGVAGSAQFAVTEAMARRRPGLRGLLGAAVLPAVGLCAFEYGGGEEG